MSSAQHLREFISQRLTAAAEEIFTEFEKTIVQYEEEIDRQRRLLDITWKPRINLPTADRFICNKEELPAAQQLWNQEKDLGLDLEEPEPAQMKEEEGELCPGPEEQLVLKQEADGFMVNPTLPMADLSGEVREIICQTLAHLSADTTWQIILKLQSSGLKAKEDLKYVQQEDLADLLPVIQCRKLLDAFRSETEIVTLDLQAVPASSPMTRALSSPEFSLPSLSTPPHSSSSQRWPIAPCSEQPSHSPPQMLRTWPETFQVPWELMPQEIRAAVAEGRRPKPVERRQMVRVLADEMRRYEAHPTRTQCLTVVQNIVRRYPKSFADITPNGLLLSGGYTSLLIQVKNRIENVNRDVSFSHRRSSTKRGPSDTYGCARFQPELPPGESDETVEQHRRRLVEIYRQEGGAGGAGGAEVKALMELTFSLQRRHINSLPPPDTEELKSKWPFLFTPTYIYAHFELLTDINVLRCLELSMEECGGAITQYFREKPTNKDVKTVVSEGDDDEVTLRVVQLLMAHFEEDLTGLILLADASAADIETTLSLPASPRLILHVSGAAGQVGGWRITLQGRVICESVTPTFATGLAAVFAIYYIFNLQYQEEAACTLEFIQRRFIGINPDRGSKAKRGKVVSKKKGVVVQKKSSAVNTRVSRLLKNLLDFEWDFI
ncbi:uncharacterized protein [Leuresthes tenuis]|uniref:uncharacterized protein n=1 Tax=Leuresthes tenuis TaxID=355514 RepID=UPI003B50D5B1